MLLHTVSSRKASYTDRRARSPAAGRLRSEHHRARIRRAPRNAARPRSSAAGSSAAVSEAVPSAAEPEPGQGRRDRRRRCRTSTSSPAPSSSRPTRATRRTNSCPRAATTRSAWTSTWPTPSARCSGLKVTIEPASFDGIIAGINAGRYDIVAVLVHRHQGPRGVGQLRHLLRGRHLDHGAGRQPEEHQDDHRPVRSARSAPRTARPSWTSSTTPPSTARSSRPARTPASRPRSRRASRSRPTSTPRWLAGRIDAYLADTPVVDYAVKQTGDKFEKVGEDAGHRAVRHRASRRIRPR